MATTPEPADALPAAREIFIRVLADAIVEDLLNETASGLEGSAPESRVDGDNAEAAWRYDDRRTASVSLSGRKE